MIELLIVIAVVKLFVKKAREKNLSTFIWGVIGAVSYYGPVVLLGQVVLPELVLNGTLTFSSEGELMIKSIAIMIVGGVICCALMYQVLKRQQPVMEEQNVIDQEIE